MINAAEHVSRGLTRELDLLGLHVEQSAFGATIEDTSGCRISKIRDTLYGQMFGRLSTPSLMC